MRQAVLLFVVLALAVILPGTGGFAEEPGKKKPAKVEDKVRELMHRKLDYSQKVLAGIALDDFDQISKNAAELMVLSNKLEWNVLKTPQYDLHSNEFRRSLESLIKNAEKKNLDAAALAYVEMTLTCVPATSTSGKFEWPGSMERTQGHEPSRVQPTHRPRFRADRPGQYSPHQRGSIIALGPMNRLIRLVARITGLHAAQLSLKGVRTSLSQQFLRRTLSVCP